MRTLHKQRLCFIAAGLILSGALARADVALLLEEPFGTFGGMTPTGHAALYFSRICAASPLVLRRCNEGEQGVVISRYHRVSGYDWLAIPVVPYLYAVDQVDQVPEEATPTEVKMLRDDYRRKHLEAIAPDDKTGEAPPGDWIQLVGASYDRAIYAFGIQTSAEQDDRFIQTFNAAPNENHFSLLFHNCADFVRQAINFYHPKAIHRSLGGDVGIMTPKQAAKCLVKFSKRNPELQSYSFAIAQIPGTIPRSRPVRGVLESFMKSKRYILPLAPLALLHPYVGGTLVVAWLGDGRFDPRRSAGGTDAVHEPEQSIHQLQFSSSFAWRDVSPTLDPHTPSP